MSQDRFEAVSAFRDALDMPDSANWRAIAEALAAVMPTVKAPKPAADAPPSWWNMRPLPKHYETQAIEVTFSDREIVRCEMHRASGKPWQVERATRVAVEFWRARHRTGCRGTGIGDGPVPEITLIHTTETAETWCAETVTRLSEAFRAPLAPAVRPAAPPDARTVARLAEIVARRRAGLARIEADGGDADGWRVALAHGEAELADTVARVAAAAGRGGAPLALDWCETLAEGYGAPADSEVSGTFDAPALALDSAALAPPVEAIASAPPVEAIATESAPEYACADEWRPSIETHPIVAVCASEKAAERLFERVQDGTWRASDRTAKGGAWRITLADARDLEGLPSVRLIGMPRKAYTRRAAPPVVAIATPVVGIPGFVPSPAFIPGAAFPDGACVLHSPAL